MRKTKLSTDSLIYCDFCGKGDKDFRDPRRYKLIKIVDQNDRDNFAYAHKDCIVYASQEYKKLMKLKQLLKEVMT